MTDLCIVMGNGPSLKGFDFTRLNGVTTLGMNAAYRYWDQIGWYPTPIEQGPRFYKVESCGFL